MNLTTGIRGTAVLGALLAALALGGCGGGGGNDGGGGTSGGTTGGSTGGSTGGAAGPAFYISFDAGGDAGTVDVYDAALSTRTARFDSGLNEGIVDIGGTVNAIGVIGGTPTLRQIADFANRGSAAFDPAQDGQFQFAEMRAPKGIAFAGLTRNQLIVGDAAADVTGEVLATVPSLHVLTTLVGLIPPQVLTSVSVETAGGRTWDMAYDGISDRLYAAMTNGSIAVYDNFITRANLAGLGGPAVVPSRTITPGAIVDGVSRRTSVNLHGITYDRGTNRLVVSDVGLATSDSDGALFVIRNASSARDTATGTGGDEIVVPVRSISGPSTRLGNPVDVLMRGQDLYVAEKLNGGGQILRFNLILTGNSGDIAPNQAVSTASLGSVGGPESIAPPN